MTQDAVASASKRSSRVRSPTRTRARGATGTEETEALARRGSRSGSTPGRTVTICTGERVVMDATTLPPKAGFHAIKR